MTPTWQQTLALGGVVAAGINGGVFFGFSNFVMPALANLPTNEGVSAMQAINEAAPNPAFMATLFGAGLIGIPAAVSAVGNLNTSQAKFQLAAMALSMGTIAITAAFHVPRNNALAAVQPTATASTARIWAGYVVSWTRGNHIRTLTSVASTACFAMTLRRR